MSLPIVRRHLLIAGRVQGVAFRHTTRVEAEALGIAGWVRNLADGRVEAVLQGEVQAVEAMVAWCRLGPSGARVDEVLVSAEEPSGDYAGFRVVATAQRPS